MSDSNTFYIGCHLSSSSGYAAMANEAASIDANVIQFFTRNPRGGQAKPLNPADVVECNEIRKEHGIDHVIAHAPYTMNPSAASEEIRKYTAETMCDDLRRLSHLPGSMYNFHPGCHVKQGVDAAVGMIAQLLDRLATVETETLVLLETMAGKGTEVGGRFEELKMIMDATDFDQNRLGVTLDTCHVFDGGYDIKDSLDSVIDEFDSIVGIGKLKAIHLNDSMFGLSSHKDRHAKIGEGHLGIEAVTAIINHPLLRDLPFCLETPNDVPGYKNEIALLRSLRS